MLRLLASADRLFQIGAPSSQAAQLRQPSRKRNRKDNQGADHRKKINPFVLALTFICFASDLLVERLDSIRVDLLLRFVFGTEQHSPRLLLATGADQREGAVFHFHQLDIGLIRLGRGFDAGGAGSKSYCFFDCGIQLRIEMTIPLLPFRISRSRRHARGHGQYFIQMDDDASEFLNPQRLGLKRFASRRSRE